MKGQTEIVACLASLVHMQNTALAQLRVHKNMTRVWGYARVTQSLDGAFAQLSEHLDALVQRLMTLEHAVDLQHVGRLNIGQTIEEILESERNMSLECRSLALRVLHLPASDFTARKLVEANLQIQEDRVFFCDQLLELMRQMGMQNFLATRC